MSLPENITPKRFRHNLSPTNKRVTAEMKILIMQNRNREISNEKERNTVIKAYRRRIQC